MRVDNLKVAQLEEKIIKQSARLNRIERQLDALHGYHDYSDDVAKYFHLGRVGFRKDRKRQEQSINKAVDNGVKACALYSERDNAQSIIKACQKATQYIIKHAQTDETATVKKVREQNKEKELSAAPILQWEKCTGHYGVAYRAKGFEVERCDVGFVAVRTESGKLVTHCKTVKEAKAIVGILSGREQ